MTVYSLKIWLIFIVTKLLIFCHCSFAANVYIATTGNDATGNGSIENPYLTIQKGIDSLKIQGPGNTLFLRGGTYFPTLNIEFGTLNDAYNDNWYTIRSYPGEWAIVDGTNSNGDISHGSVRKELFDGCHDGGCQGFIEFSHMELRNITNNIGNANYTSGINAFGGPYRFRYLYIHDIVCDSISNNPGGLRFGAGSGGITIEYCYIKHNGAVNVDSSSQIIILSDYKTAWGSQVITNGSGFYTARADNIYRYNLIDSDGVVDIGLYEKNVQMLASNELGTDYPVDVNTWFRLGTEAHHNIILNSMTSMRLQTDFTQCYNNILDVGSKSDSNFGNLMFNKPSPDIRGMWKNCAWNNTIIGGPRSGIEMQSKNSISVNYQKPYVVNNIIDNPTDRDAAQDVTFYSYGGATWPGIDTDLQTKNNVFYRPINATLAKIMNTVYTLLTLNSEEWASSNNSYLYSASDYLYAGTAGSNKYKLNMSYSNYSTISSGGVDESHPYLAEISLPSYIGAANPNDNRWIDGILYDLTDTDYLKNTSGDPSWIEGFPQTPPSNPTGLRVN